MMAKYHFRDDRLQCRVVELAYDFDDLAGEIYLPPGDCCDMRACIKLFEAIDERVARIDTYSGVVHDTSYIKGYTGWRAEPPVIA
jgi:hypothetical protein